MITHIFYSLVLFPSIRYFEPIASGFSLVRVDETGYGNIVAEFVLGESRETIVFFHRWVVASDGRGYETKNWCMISVHSELLHEVGCIIQKTDTHDFLFFLPKEHLSSTPFGVVLTITSRCNLFCYYCFNNYDYPLRDRNLRKWLTLDDYKSIVDKLYDAGTRDIIITGWEPFTALFLFDLLRYIRDKGIYIRINTNGTLLSDSMLERLDREFCLNLMVSMHEFNDADYFETNHVGAKNIAGIDVLLGFEKKFSTKIAQLRKISRYPWLNLTLLTILTRKNIFFLESLYKFVLDNFVLQDWHFFRLYQTTETLGASREMMSLAIHKLAKLNRQYCVNYRIVDSVPFCVTKDLSLAGNIIDGELSSGHNIKTIITVDGNIQIMSAFDSHLGSIFLHNVGEVWRSKFVRKMLKNEFLPSECKDCVCREQCRGWSRMIGNIQGGRYDAWDPIWDVTYKIIG